MEPGFDYIGVVTPFYCHDGDGNIVMQKRGENARDEIGRWDPGSGKLEKGLTLEENVLKEVKEEYNCEGEIVDSLPPHGIFREQDGERTHWLAVPFFVRVDPEEVENGEPHKFDEIKWFPINDLPENIHTGFRESYNTYREKFDEVINTADIQKKDIETVFSDISELKHSERRGWKQRGIESPCDTIASHSFGSAVIGWLVAKSEGLNPDKVASMLVFHDLMMARMEDLTPDDDNYKFKSELEQEALEEMRNDFPDLASEIFNMIDEVQNAETEIGKLAKKADKLDTLMQARSYNSAADTELLEEFLEGFQKYFRSEDNADKIFRQIEEDYYSQTGL